MIKLLKGLGYSDYAAIFMTGILALSILFIPKRQGGAIFRTPPISGIIHFPTALRAPGSISLTDYTVDEISCAQIPITVRAQACRDISARQGSGWNYDYNGATPIYDFKNQ